jgi:hypothetical protein
MLICRCLFPLPGATYNIYWDYGSPIFLWTMKIQLRRFKQLHSVLYFNSNDAEVPGKDALHKTHPLLKMLKKRMGNFMIPGSELALGEASSAPQSNFSRHIIFYNLAKNCGKFHFQFYILVDASTFAALVLKVAMINDSDPCDLNEMLESIQEESKYSNLNKLVTQMFNTYNGSGRTISMDNSYTSPSVMAILQNRGFFARGTVLKNRCMVLYQIILTKSETATLPDGYVMMAVCEFTKMLAFGWNDKNPVHIVSYADGYDSIMMVRRQRKKLVANVSCLITVPAYSKNMQGVDHHDQLQSKFVLSSRHGFKKYYIIHQLAQMDIGITHACIYHVLANPQLKKKEGHIRRMM